MVIIMNLKDIIKNKLITCNINTNLENISKLMKQSDIGFMPITKDNIIIGVITDRDIVIRGIAKGIDDLEYIISPNIISIDINSSIEKALEHFSENKVKRLLITDNDKYIGVLSINDILKIYDNKKILNTLKNIFSEKNIDINAEIDEFEL